MSFPSLDNQGAKKPAAAGGFHPTDLIGGSDNGFFLNAATTANLYQLITQATAVTAGDRVGYWEDEGSNGMDFVADGNDNTRPIYQTASSIHYLEFDQTDLRRLKNTSWDPIQDFSTGWCISAAIYHPDTGTYPQTWFSESNSTTFGNYQSHSVQSDDFGEWHNRSEEWTTDTVDGAITINDSAWHVATLTCSASQLLEAHIDGVTESDTETVTSTDTETINQAAIGQFWRGNVQAYRFDGRIAAIFGVNKPITGTDLSDLETYMGDLVGLSI